MISKSGIWKSAIFIGVLVFILFPKLEASAAEQCLCVGKDPKNTNCENAANAQDCSLIYNTSQDKYLSCSWMASTSACVDAKNYVDKQNNLVETTDSKTVGAFIPECTTLDMMPFINGSVAGECGDVTIFLVLMFNIIRYLFGIIGGVALLYFVYGGFILILSQGNTEKVAQGKAVIVAAVLGIVIAFGGYALVRFVGEIAGVEEYYMLNEVK
jgi:hypothetical protein